MDLVTDCYEATNNFPADEKFGLVSQLRRSAVSVPSNIAEGNARRHRREYLNFISIALGSVAELDTQILISLRLNYLDAQSADKLRADISVIRRKLISLHKALSTSPESP